jgi:hypothetical protein
MTIEHKDVLVIDRAITGMIVKVALAKGYSLTVDYGMDDDGITKSRDEAAINEALHACDDEVLHFYSAEGKRLGWIKFVYGECGWDVCCDYSDNAVTRDLVDAPPVKAMVDGISENPDRYRAIIAEAQAMA